MKNDNFVRAKHGPPIAAYHTGITIQVRYFTAFDRGERKANFELGSLAFVISVPVRDETDKFQHSIKITTSQTSL